MIVPCDCGARLRLDDSKIGDKGVRVRCPRCGAILEARKPEPLMTAPTPPVQAARQEPPAAPEERMPAGSASALVIVALENENARGMIRNILLEQGFGVEEAADGLEALQKTSELHPQAMIVDVGLPGIYGFELCERIKESQKASSPRIILLTSTYDANRYRREPVCLYGADDYIEKHQIADLLVLKIRRLIDGEAVGTAQETEAGAAPDVSAEAPRSRPEPEPFEFSPETLLRDEPEDREAAPAAQTTAAPQPPAAEPSSWLDTFIQQAQEGSAMSPDSFSVESSVLHGGDKVLRPVDEGDPEAVAKAKRLARIIVSDIALYNQEIVREGISKGTFYELLKDDIEEGRQLFEKRVPSAIRELRNYYREAFDSFIEAQKKIVR